MRISQLTAYTVSLPLKREFKHASASRTESTNLIVKACLSDGTTGWGEGVPREYVTGETPQGALQQFQATNWTGQIGADCTDWAEVLDLCQSILPAPQKDDPRGCFGNALRCAVELSVLDAYGRLLQCPVRQVTAELESARAVCSSRDRVRYSTTISAQSPAKEISSAIKMRLYGFRQCKVKVGLAGADDAQRLQRIRRCVGRRMDLRLDANEAWRVDEAVRQIDSMAPFRVSCVEQPVAHRELDALSELRSRVDVPIMLDESLTSSHDAQRAIETQACDLFNIRLSKCGGFLASLKLAVMATEAGLGYQLGCHPGESGLLSAAGRHFATSVNQIAYLEGSYDRHLLTTQLTEPDITFGYGGQVDALTAPGLGVTVLPDRLEAMKQEQVTCEVK